ncbi:MAG: acyloxyacyl hydrolase [Sphingobacteriales bacterium]|nr:MAG: acyloxyacyl hydrolase [Sphingobacteriales bacterium]
MKCVLFTLIILLCSCLQSGAQELPPGFGLEMNGYAGKILKHTKNFKAPVPELSTGLELNFLWQTYGKKPWQQRRGFPLLGFGIGYTDYGIDSIFGKCISFYPNIQLRIISGRKLEWTAKAGFGIGYMTRHYKRAPDWDTINNAIGSHFNNFTIFSSDLRLHVSKHLDLQLGAHFTHVSNGALRVPNLGLNFYGLHAGIRYFPVTGSPDRIMRKMAPIRNRWLGQLRVGLAGTEGGVINGPLYPVYLASAFVSRRYHSHNKLLIGLDYSYHKSTEAFLKNNEIFPGEEGRHSWKGGLFAANEFLVGRVGIVLQAGYYLNESALKLERFYQKLGGNLYLVQREKGALKEMFVSILLKTHKTQAELAELGMGIGF